MDDTLPAPHWAPGYRGPLPEGAYSADQVRAIIAECRRPAANGDAVARLFRSGRGNFAMPVDTSSAAIAKFALLRDGAQFYTAPPPAVPAGWKLVPVEPTQAMRDAGYVPILAFKTTGFVSAAAVYRAMLDSAPLAGKGETK